MLLYYITDRKQLGGTEALLDRIRAAADAGVDWIQIREKDLPTRELEHLSAAAREAIAESPTKLLINSRVDIAIACGLDGVHLTSSADELPASDARAMFAKAGIHQPIIGVSCHSIEDVLSAESHGADLVVYGPTFGKAGERGTGVATLREVCAALPAGSSMDVVALGGITAKNARECIAAGADGVAGIRLFQESDVTLTVASLRKK